MAGTIGFIGLGIMGLPMARNLLKAGYGLVAHDIVRGRMKMLGQDGARLADTAAEVARECKAIITMLPNGPEVEEVILGPKGVIKTVTQGTVIVDMSSIAPPVTLKVGERLAAKGVTFIDAPVSGGEPGAVEGALAIMVGGPEDAVEDVRPMLEKMGKSVVRVGELGAGQTAKIVNQVLVALHLQAMGEALVLTKKAGVSPAAVFAAIRGGLAGSNVLNAKVERVLARDFKPGFRMRLHQKDLNNALATAQELGLSLPATGMVAQFLNGLVGQGKGDEDHGGLVQAIEQINGVCIE